MSILKNSMMAEYGESQSVVTFGSMKLEPIPYPAINELSQVRTGYDPGAIDDLAWSMQRPVIEGEPAQTFELINPLTIGRFTPPAAARYINDWGEYYRVPKGERTDWQDLRPLPGSEGQAAILISGHRRRRAIGRLIERHLMAPEEVLVVSSVLDDIEFAQGIALQLRENVYDRPSPQDEARAIDLWYRYTVGPGGEAPNIATLSKQLGFSETKVRDALAFASLPESVQSYTRDGVLSYSIVRQLKPLYDAYRSLYGDDDKARLSIHTFCDIALSRYLQGNSESKFEQLIKNKVKEIRGQAEYQQEEFTLFSGDEYTVQRGADSAARRLGDTAAAVLRYQLNQGGVSEAMVRDLEALIANYREAQGCTQNQRPLF